MASNQAYLFMVFSIVGVIIGLLFDIFRIIRKTFKTNDIITYLEDILFWILTGIIIIYAMYKFCDGELRFFMIMGIILGTCMYIVTISQYVIKISVFIINIAKKILIYPTIAIYKLIRRIIFRPIFIICVNLRKNLKGIVKKNKKSRGIFEKKEKYNSI